MGHCEATATSYEIAVAFIPSMGTTTILATGPSLVQDAALRTNRTERCWKCAAYSAHDYTDAV